MENNKRGEESPTEWSIALDKEAKHRASQHNYTNWQHDAKWFKRGALWAKQFLAATPVLQEGNGASRNDGNKQNKITQAQTSLLLRFLTDNNIAFDNYPSSLQEGKGETEGEKEKLFNKMGVWATCMFPDAGPVEHLKKLQKETVEAIEAPNDVEEYADCLLALYGAAFKAGISRQQLKEAAEAKFQKVQRRKWMKQADGTYQHIKEVEEAKPTPNTKKPQYPMNPQETPLIQVLEQFRKENEQLRKNNAVLNRLLDRWMQEYGDIPSKEARRRSHQNNLPYYRATKIRKAA